jgi:four helix bundle protein
MQPDTSYTRLEVWQLAIEFCVDVYRVTQAFPRTEMYGLTRQLREAAVSVSANIAEGSGRRSKAEFAHFLAIAEGSLREAETLIHVAHRIGYVADPAALFEISQRIGRMVTRLRQSLEREVPMNGRKVHANDERRTTKDGKAGVR